MPISTPSDMVQTYSGDEDHFNHVLHHLFIPAIKQLDIEPIPPAVKGADLIHAEIIKNIESCDFLLCDMSILNPNVFFELGIRTAINKPVALVKDDATKNVPFDTHIINNHTYSHALQPWTLDAEIESLVKHLTHCFDAAQKENSLWKYFSLSTKADTLHKPESSDEKIAYLTMQVAALRSEIGDKKRSQYVDDVESETLDLVFDELKLLGLDEKLKVLECAIDAEYIYVYLSGYPSEKLARKMAGISMRYGKKLKIHQRPDK